MPKTNKITICAYISSIQLFATLFLFIWCGTRHPLYINTQISKCEREKAFHKYAFLYFNQVLSDDIQALDSRYRRNTALHCNKAILYWHCSILWIWMGFADISLHFFEQQMHSTLLPACILISLAFLYIWYFPTLVNNDDSKFSLIYIHIT